MVTITDLDREILICRINGEFYALSPFCTHYGAPLEEGILSNGRIICPWHHACFDSKTGDIVEPPAIDSLIQYETSTENGNLLVKIPEDEQKSSLPDMSKSDINTENKTFVILGAGAAGYTGSQSLREHGFKGRITIITHENKLPYDRPNLSKDYLEGTAKGEWMPLRSQEFYDKFGINMSFGKRIISLDTHSKKVTLDSKETIEYDKLLIATGGVARKINVPGSDKDNIFTLRSYQDADDIIKSIKNITNASIIGSSFIGMETAKTLKERGLNVQVVSNESLPFAKIFGQKVGKLILKEYEKMGISFKLGLTVSQFSGDEKVEKIIL